MKKLLLSLSVLFSVSAFSQASLSQSLVACYALDANAAEPINSMTGTLTAVTPTVNRFSQPNTALSFLGSASSYVKLPNSSIIKPNAVSLSCWVKANSISSAAYIVFTTNGCGSYYEGYALLMIQTGAGQFQFQAVKSSSMCTSIGQTALYGTTTTYSVGNWYHIGAYIGPDSLKLYVNGLPNGAIANSTPLAYGSTNNVYLGGTNQSPNFPLNGSIDNLRIYNRKLSGTEFNQLFTLDPICQPQPFASFVATPSVGICTGQAVSLISTSTNSPTTYNWTMSGGTPSVSSVSNPTVSFATPGTHTITLVASNAFGSSTPYTQVLTVASCIGINEQGKLESVTVAPNPTSGELFINGLPPGSAVQVYDLLGNVVDRITTESDKEKLNLSLQAPGIYFVNVQSEGRTATVKIIKE